MSSIELIDAGIGSTTRRNVLMNIDCRFQTGEFTVLTGQNGSGKSLLIQVLGGILPPDSGKIMWGSRRIRGSADFPRNSVVIVPQDPKSFFLAPRVDDEISIGFSRSNLKSSEYKDRITEGLAWAQLIGRRSDSPLDLSHTEQRFLAIASAIVLRPQFIVLDDPLSAMDRSSASIIIEKLVTLAREGTGIIVACQDLERILAHADRLILMKQGRIIVDALPSRVLPYLEAHGVRKPPLKLEEMTWLHP